ncbi:MAG: tetratricopeptide repeat protein, partial [Gemmatimonadetes bacterium]|nr:tetratricopeptide repeat protein [Gemmatimonadota bacterium]
MAHKQRLLSVSRRDRLLGLLLALFMGSWGWIGCGEKEQQTLTDGPSPNAQKEGKSQPLKVEQKEQIAAEIYYRRGRRYLQNGQYEEAIGEFSRAVHLKPDFALALDQIGLAYTLQLRPGEAIPYYKRAIAQAPENGIFLMHLGKTYMDLRDYAAAKRAYRRALELGVRRAKIYYDLGVVSER